MIKKTQDFLVKQKTTVKEVMRYCSKTGQKQVFVVDKAGCLVGAISDGDIRRWILKGGSLDETVGKVCNQAPTTITSNYDLEEVKELLLKEKIEAIPVIDDQRRILEILTWDMVFAGKVERHREPLNIPVVIMAGGKGTRLDPFTRILPKPLIPIGDKPVLQIIMDKFAEYEVKEFFLSVNHKAKMIRSYFEDNDAKYRIHYIEEDTPMGTAGSLVLLKGRIKGTFLVANCDVIIDIDYNEVVKFHKDHGYDMTVIVSCKRYIIPYGVCEVQGNGVLKSVREKPEYDFLVNTGMYVMEPKVLELIPAQKVMDANELIDKLKKKGFSVGVFPIDEKSWIDVGQWEEYQKAVKILGG